MRRVIMVSLCVATGVTMLVAVFQQQNRINTLKAEHAHVLARRAAPAEMPLPDAPADPQEVKQSPPSPSMELLQLRAEVTRLGNRKRELANTPIENERFRVQLATRGTNVTGAVALPAGYIRKSEARRLGFNTPEATMETLLWAIQNRDFTTVLEAFTPETARGLQREIEKSGGSTEEFFKSGDSLVGFSVLSREQKGSDDTIGLQVEMVPGLPPETMRFQKINGQWKMETH